MLHNKKSPYEKPLSECPKRCADCEFFNGKEGCYANNTHDYTLSFCNPKDRCVPFPLNCCWWYANNVFEKMSSAKIEEYKEERAHLFAASAILENLHETEARKEFVSHYFRQGGFHLIDFEKYPQALKFYNDFKQKEM